MTGRVWQVLAVKTYISPSEFICFNCTYLKQNKKYLIYESLTAEKGLFDFFTKQKISLSFVEIGLEN